MLSVANKTIYNECRYVECRSAAHKSLLMRCGCVDQMSVGQMVSDQKFSSQAICKEANFIEPLTGKYVDSWEEAFSKMRLA